MVYYYNGINSIFLSTSTNFVKNRCRILKIYPGEFPLDQTKSKSKQTRMEKPINE